MFKRAIATILILFLAGGAIFYLHQQKEFIGYFPRLDHIVRHPDQHLSEWRHGASNIMADLHKMFSETLPNIDGMSTLKKYLPFPELKPEKSPDKTPNQVKVSPISRDGWTSMISIFKNPGRSSGTPAPVVYTWVDKRGIRHFSEVKPLDSPYEIEIAQP